MSYTRIYDTNNLPSNITVYNANKLQNISVTNITPPDNDSILVYDSPTQEYQLLPFIQPTTGINFTGLMNSTVLSYVSNDTPYGREIKNTLFHNFQQKLNSSDGLSNDRFGNSVCISSDGQFAVIGAPNEDTTAANSGAVYIFTRSGTTWTQQQKIKAPIPQINSSYGSSICISANKQYVAIGSFTEDISSTDNGAVYVYTYDGTTLSYQAKLIAPDPSTNGFFGRVISMSGEGRYILIGSEGSVVEEILTGAAYVFIRDGTEWTLQQKLSGSDSQTDTFGASVYISANNQTAVIGAPNEDSQSGAVYIFTRSGTTWTQQQKIKASDPSFIAHFGSSVCVTSDCEYIAVGCKDESSIKSINGAVYIFNKDTSQSWSQQQKLLSSIPNTSTNFGLWVSISSDGYYLAIGSQNIGFVFTRNGNAWTQQQKITAPDILTNITFGSQTSISMDGQYALFGATLGKSGSVISGAAYMYKTDDYIPLKTTGINVDATTDLTYTMLPITNSLIKTGDTLNGGYSITLPVNMVDGRIITIFMTYNDTTGVTFIPSVVGFANGTNIGAYGKIMLIYIATTNAWYNIS